MPVRTSLPAPLSGFGSISVGTAVLAVPTVIDPLPAACAASGLSAIASAEASSPPATSRRFHDGPACSRPLRSAASKPSLRWPLMARLPPARKVSVPSRAPEKSLKRFQSLFNARSPALRTSMPGITASPVPSRAATPPDAALKRAASAMASGLTESTVAPS
ncbi:hypothetical protein D9M72_286110 [compost metagenome]